MGKDKVKVKSVRDQLKCTVLFTLSASSADLISPQKLEFSFCIKLYK